MGRLGFGSWADHCSQHHCKIIADNDEYSTHRQEQWLPAVVNAMFYSVACYLGQIGFKSGRVKNVESKSLTHGLG